MSDEPTFADLLDENLDLQNSHITYLRETIAKVVEELRCYEPETDPIPYIYELLELKAVFQHLISKINTEISDTYASVARCPCCDGRDRNCSRQGSLENFYQSQRQIEDEANKYLPK